MEESKLLGDYPFDRLPALVNEFAGLGVESAEFDKLFELVVTALEKRKGDAAGAELLSYQGFKKLEAGHPYEAILLLGRAMERFIKREHRDDLIFCLMGLSQAYHEAGLLWAARSCALAATERCFAYFRESGTIVRRSLLCLQQLERMELFLGRIPQLLIAMELETVLVPQLMLQDYALKRAQNNRQLMEGMLGILFLSASLDQLRHMADTPEALEQIGIFIPKACLMYALGYKKELSEEGFPSVEQSDSFMKLAYEQPGRLQLPARPQIDDGQSVTYKTNVLGCEVSMLAQANAFSISVAEAILGSIEAFFATSLNEPIYPYRQSARIIPRCAFDLKKGLVVSEKTEGAETHLVVLHPVSAPEMTPENRKADRDGLMEVIARFVLHIAVIEDVEKYFEKIAGEERGFVRALVYSEASLAQENLFGNKPKVLIGDWKPEGEAKSYPLARSVEWTEGVELKQMSLPAGEEKDDAPVQGEAEMRAQFRRSMETVKHSQRQIVSLIDIRLWNRASWRGTIFYFDPGKAPYPILAIGFEDRAAAAQIFKGLINQLGEVDKDNKLRVTIVRGIRKDNPAAYRIVIGSEFDRPEAGGKIAMMVTRTNVMEPATTESLGQFLTSIESSPEYLLAPAHYNSQSGRSSIGFRLAIQKSGLVVRNAWEIAVGDVDVMGLSPDDDPVIPAGVENPPCKEVLAFLKSRQRS